MSSFSPSTRIYFKLGLKIRVFTTHNHLAFAWILPFSLVLKFTGSQTQTAFC